MTAIHQAKWEMIESGARTAESFGLNALLGRIYMTLYLSQNEQCLDDIVEYLGVSKASISIACRQLESWGAVRKVYVKGDRKDYYRAESSLRDIFNNGFLSSVSKKLQSAQTQIERSLSYLDNGDSQEDADFLKERLNEAERYRMKMEKLVENPIIRKLI